MNKTIISMLLAAVLAVCCMAGRAEARVAVSVNVGVPVCAPGVVVTSPVIVGGVGYGCYPRYHYRPYFPHHGGWYHPHHHGWHHGGYHHGGWHHGGGHHHGGHHGRR